MCWSLISRHHTDTAHIFSIVVGCEYHSTRSYWSINYEIIINNGIIIVAGVLMGKSTNIGRHWWWQHVVGSLTLSWFPYDRSECFKVWSIPVTTLRFWMLSTDTNIVIKTRKEWRCRNLGEKASISNYQRSFCKVGSCDHLCIINVRTIEGLETYQ